MVVFVVAFFVEEEGVEYAIIHSIKKRNLIRQRWNAIINVISLVTTNMNVLIKKPRQTLLRLKKNYY